MENYYQIMVAKYKFEREKRLLIFIKSAKGQKIQIKFSMGINKCRSNTDFKTVKKVAK
jgi:hypothetical protein